jgi:hypothetical protein
MKKLNEVPFVSKLRYAPREPLDCFQGSYANGQTVLLLRDAITGEPACKATVAVEPWQKIPADCVVIKNWSENEGVEETLLAAGIIEPLNYPRSIPCGHVTANVYRLKEQV